MRPQAPNSSTAGSLPISLSSRKLPRFLAAVVIGLVVATAGVAAQPRSCDSREPVNTLKELGQALYACWQPPPGNAGMEITLSFSLRRDGSLLGKPRATWSKLSGTMEEQRAFVASVLAALDEALPVPLTDSMGGAIAGNPLTMRFSAVRRGPEQAL